MTQFAGLGRKGIKDAQPGPVLSWPQRVKIALEAAKGLEYLHEEAQPHIIHRAIKSSNVLLFNDGIAKISDIIFSYQAPDIPFKTTWYFGVGGRFGYDAPEFAVTERWSSKCDVYSFGVVLLELLTGRKPYESTRPREQLRLVTWAIPKLTEEKLKQCIDPRLNGEYPPRQAAQMAAVAALCLQYEPNLRPNMRIVVKVLQSLL
ncbi:hypothetical protein LguiA_001616 [Lonicera macranthoides]